MTRSRFFFLLLCAPVFLGAMPVKTLRLPEGTWHDGWITLRPGYKTTGRMKAVLHNKGKDAVTVENQGAHVPASLLVRRDLAWVDAGPMYCGDIDWNRQVVAPGDSLEFEVFPNNMLSDETKKHIDEYRVSLPFRHSLDGTWANAVSRQSFLFPRR